METKPFIVVMTTTISGTKGGMTRLRPWKKSFIDLMNFEIDYQQRL
jgi:hypothetical protein